jgi:hypothetical protein
MAVARVLTDPQPQQVNINSQGNASPPGVKINNAQPVQFNNNSGSAISISFLNTAITGQRVFNDLNIAAGQNVTESPLVSDITVNYNLNIGGNSYGPYAIEVGTGPLQISVTNGYPNPSTAVIPPNGEIQFAATDTQCSISWGSNDPFTPPLNTVYVGQSNNPVGSEQGNSGRNFPYTLNTTGPVAVKANRVMAGGGGTIKVT